MLSIQDCKELIQAVEHQERCDGDVKSQITDEAMTYLKEHLNYPDLIERFKAGERESIAKDAIDVWQNKNLDVEKRIRELTEQKQERLTLLKAKLYETIRELQLKRDTGIDCSGDKG